MKVKAQRHWGDQEKPSSLWLLGDGIKLLKLSLGGAEENKPEKLIPLKGSYEGWENISACRYRFFSTLLLEWD